MSATRTGLANRLTSTRIGRPRREADDARAAEGDDRRRIRAEREGLADAEDPEHQDDDEEDERVEHHLDQETAHAIPPQRSGPMTRPSRGTGHCRSSAAAASDEPPDVSGGRRSRAADRSASTAPTHQCSTPAASRASSMAATWSGVDRREQAARGLRVVGEGHELRARRRRRPRATAATKRRLWAAPPVSTPAAASLERAGQGRQGGRLERRSACPTHGPSRGRGRAGRSR